ncbi:hypothetical protein [Amycolatopsis sp. WAC 01416]|nr:hypothetical protein [Amycolatopsis sp. WAC 01416]
MRADGGLAGPASAAVPTSKRFDLTKPSYDEFRGKILQRQDRAR